MMEIPVLSPLARQRGWPFLMAWVHRITGLSLVVYALLHIQTLSLITNADAYDLKMTVFSGPVFVFLEWALAIPVMLHAINGGRLIVYEIFTFRNDIISLKNVFVFSGLYMLVLAIMMGSGDQVITPLAFWVPVLMIALTVSWSLTFCMIKSGLSLTFVLQRVTGVFLLIMIPAHLFFMHLSPQISKSSVLVIQRMRLPFIQLVDVMLVIAVLYHATHGLLSIAFDYIPRGLARTLLTIAVILVMGFFGCIGLYLIWSI